VISEYLNSNGPWVLEYCKEQDAYHTERLADYLARSDNNGYIIIEQADTPEELQDTYRRRRRIP